MRAYTDADLERAGELWSDEGPSRGDVAELIVEVRAEARMEIAEKLRGMTACHLQVQTAKDYENWINELVRELEGPDVHSQDGKSDSQ